MGHKEPRDDRAIEPENSRETWSSKRSPSIAIVEAVAAETGRTATALPPLHDYIDVDSLDGLLQNGNSAPTHTVRVSFQYAGVEVTADSTGDIAVTERE